MRASATKGLPRADPATEKALIEEEIKSTVLQPCLEHRAFD